MQSMVDIIASIEANLKELEENGKKVEKALKALMEEKELIDKNKIMFRKSLESLTGIKNEEIQATMAEKPEGKKEVAATPIVAEHKAIKPNVGVKVDEKDILELEKEGNIVASKKEEIKTEKQVNNPKGNVKPVCAIDEFGVKIAEYNTRSEAAADLKIDMATLKWRIEQVPVETQIKRWGYALKKM